MDLSKLLTSGSVGSSPGSWQPCPNKFKRFGTERLSCCLEMCIMIWRLMSGPLDVSSMSWRKERFFSGLNRKLDSWWRLWGSRGHRKLKNGEKLSNYLSSEYSFYLFVAYDAKIPQNSSSLLQPDFRRNQPSWKHDRAQPKETHHDRIGKTTSIFQLMQSMIPIRLKHHKYFYY